MNAAESLVIVRMVSSLCPQQRLDQYTPDIWHEILADLDFPECRTAVIELGKRQAFVAPSDIRAEVRRIRNGRIADVAEDVPDADPADVAAYLEALRQQRHRTADGEQPRPVVALVETAARRHGLPRDVGDGMG